MFLKILWLGLAIEISVQTDNFSAGEFNEVRYDNFKVLKFTPQSTKSLQALYEMQNSDMSGFDFWGSVGPVGMPVEVMVPPYRFGDVNELNRKVGLAPKVMIDNVQHNIDKETISSRRFYGFGWKSYKSLQQINGWLRSLVEEYPGIVTLIELNSTYEGRPIVGVKVSFGHSILKKAVFLESNMHGREWITSSTTTYILNALLTSRNSAIRKLAESYNWYVFPIANPDGFEYSHTKDRMWRKTRVPYTPLCTGADANKNWDYFWNDSFQNTPCSKEYNGPRPFSEPCTKLLSEFITSIASELVAYLSFHASGQLLLIPFGYTKEHLQNYDLAYNIGLKAVQALAERYGTVYRIGSVYDTIYQKAGSSTDWVKGVFKVPLVYMYELRDLGRYGFLLPAEEIIPTSKEVLDSLIVMFREYEVAVKKNVSLF